jgi:hypothetical protein
MDYEVDMAHTHSIPVYTKQYYTDLKKPFIF